MLKYWDMMRKLKNTAHKYEAILANLLYGRPARKISTIGVTGTDGKTTTASLIFHILKESGYKTAMVTTIGAQIGNSSFDTGLHTTTPSSFFLQKYIKKAVDAKCAYLVLEVTSHALDQNRVHGVDFAYGVVTNITHDHLDYHKTYDEYLLAKARLLKRSVTSIINRDDKSYQKLSETLKGKRVLAYSCKSNADYSKDKLNIKFPKQFSFNSENFMAAVAVCRELGLTDTQISKGLSTFTFPEGRQEIIYDNDFKVIIDFAHTPNSFAKVLPEAKRLTKGRLIHVFGAAGERDKSKRPLMGEISSNSADIIVLTAEDPRHEDVNEINEQIKLGMDKSVKLRSKSTYSDLDGKVCISINDRADAIKFAISLAKAGDTVIITGKGHEKSMNLGNGETPWSDKKAALDALK